MCREGRDEVALWDAASGERLSFGQLARRVDRRARLREPFEVVRGGGVEFLLKTLVAWRDGVCLIPCDDERAATKLPVVLEGVCHGKRTSGSTGEPRLVWFTASQLKADVDQIVATMGLRRDWPNAGVISLAHSYGFSNLVLPLLLHGIPLTLGTDPLPAGVQRLLGEHEAVTLPAVPAMWRAWLGSGILDTVPVRLAISAGAPLTLSLERLVYERTGLKIHNFYGSTECGGIAYDASSELRRDVRDVGRAMEGVTLSVVEGCLRVESPAVGWGYADGGSKDVLGEERFLTADRASIDESGRVFLLGRRGEMINVAGRKVSPQSMEEMLNGLEGVGHAVVFGVPSGDAERVDDIVAVVSLEDVAAGETVKAEARRRLPAWKCPRYWWMCQELKPDVRGKISRSEWRRRFQERRSALD